MERGFGEGCVREAVAEGIDWFPGLVKVGVGSCSDFVTSEKYQILNSEGTFVTEILLTCKMQAKSRQSKEQ